MRPERSDSASLYDMLRFAREVTAFVEGRTWDQFLADVQFRRAVERSVELVGEAARRVSRQFEAAHPEIPWNRIIVQRHRLAHEYDTIDDSIIWSVATKYVPALVQQLERLMPLPPPDPEAPTAP